MSLRPGSGGGGGGGSSGITSGTYAARPTSPSVGDRYIVTSGQRQGSIYRCIVAGVLDLETVSLGLGEALLLDAECLPAQQLMRARVWPQVKPGPLAAYISGSNIPKVIASSLGGMPALGFGTTATGDASSFLRVDGVPCGLGLDKTVMVAVSSVTLTGNLGLFCLGSTATTTGSVGVYSTFTGSGISNVNVEYDGGATSQYNGGTALASGAGVRTVAWSWESAAAKSRLYVAGSPTATASQVPGASRGVLDAASVLILGGGRSSLAAAGDFTLHTVAVWPRRLSDAEVASAHALLAARFS